MLESRPDQPRGTQVQTVHVLVERKGAHPARIPLWVSIVGSFAAAAAGLFPGWVALVWILVALIVLARLRHN
jgi:hypothetical protein